MPSQKTLSSLTHLDLYNLELKNKPDLVSFAPSATIREILKTLAAKNVSTIAVQSSSNPDKITALLGLHDVVAYLVAHAKDENMDLVLEADVTALMSLEREAESYRVWEFDIQDTLAGTIKAFAHDIHRCLITDATKRHQPYILSQSDIVTFLSHHPEYSKVDFGKSVDNAGLVPNGRKVWSVTASTPVVEAFKSMHVHKVLAVPVMDQGNIVATLAASDLRGVTSETLAKLVQMSTMDFLKHHRAHHIETKSVVARNDPLAKVLQTMVLLRAHRVWIDEEDGSSVVGVITMSDLCNVLV